MYVYLSSSDTITSGGEGTWTKSTESVKMPKQFNKSRNLLVTVDVGLGTVVVLSANEESSTINVLSCS